MIKKVKAEELEACAEVIREGFGTVAKDFHLTVENCATNGAFMTYERLRGEFEAGKPMYAYWENDQIAGFYELGDQGVRDGVHAVELEKITVLPRFRHHAIGRKLIADAKEKVKVLGGDVITIGIIEENTVLKEWYIQNGFVHNGTRKFEHLPFTVGFMSCKIKGE